jgi:hypothetical protein
MEQYSPGVRQRRQRPNKLLNTDAPQAARRLAHTLACQIKTKERDMSKLVEIQAAIESLPEDEYAR